MPYTGESESITKGSQGKIQGRNKSRAETGTESLEKFCLLTCTPELTQFAFLYSPRPPVLGWHHVQWNVPFDPNIRIKKKLFPGDKN